MKAIRYYKVMLTRDGNQTPVFFYETVNGEFDLQFGWAAYSSCMHKTLEGAIADLLAHVQREHKVIASISKPIEVSKDEVFNKA